MPFDQIIGVIRQIKAGCREFKRAFWLVLKVIESYDQILTRNSIESPQFHIVRREL